MRQMSLNAEDLILTAIDAEQTIKKHKESLVFMNHNAFGRVSNARYLRSHIKMALTYEPRKKISVIFCQKILRLT